MERTIIAVYGRQNEGKSETIKMVCKELVANYPNAKCSSSIDYSGDILEIIQLDKIKIGLESQGDPNSRMISEDTVCQLADPKTHGCDIIICATRTEGMTVKKVDSIANKYDFHTLWISSFWSPFLDPKVLNRMAALNIIEIVKALIIGQLKEK